MTRGLGVGVAAAVAAERVARTMAVDLDFPSGTARFALGTSDLVLNGATYLAVGMLAAVGTSEESTEIKATGLTIQLSGIPRDAIILTLLQGYQGRRGTVWEVVCNPDTFAVIGQPICVFRGRMDAMNVELGETATVSVTLESRLADWSRARIRRYTDEDQQKQFPGDTGFRFVPSITEKEIVWPGRAWFERR